MRKTILAEDISVIVQGPIVSAGQPDQYATRDVLKSVRQWLPGAELIMSTWEGSHTDALDYDSLLLSKDPGGAWAVEGRPSNINRQIISTLGGLKKAGRRYAVKLRSDSILNGAGFLGYFQKFPLRSEKCRIFRQRIAACECYFRNPVKWRRGYLFHPSDIFQFGLRSDLLALWDIPLADKNACVVPTQPIPFLYQFEPCWQDKVEEQYIWLACLQKHNIHVNLNYQWEFSLRLAELSELSIANNFIIMPMAESGVNIPDKIARYNQELVYKHGEWRKIYRLYCSNKLPGIRKLARRIELLTAHYRAVCHHLRGELNHWRVRVMVKLRKILGLPDTTKMPAEYPKPFAPVMVWIKGEKFPVRAHLNDNYEYPEWHLPNQEKRPYSDAVTWWAS